MENNRRQEDSQILSEIVANERILTYPGKGKIRFRFPTLQIQRKIDAATRLKKKLLRETVDELPDPDSPSGFRLVPAYKSRQMLQQEYQSLGWWTPEQEEKMEELSRLYVESIARLEILGFESFDSISEHMQEMGYTLHKLTDNELTLEETKEVTEAIFRLIQVTLPSSKEDTDLVKKHAVSTEVDDILASIEKLKAQNAAYMDLVNYYGDLTKLEQDRSSLFADSWQSQLEYFTKLAQAFYCTEYADTRLPLYDKIDDIEKEEDTEFITWMFTELQALWQGLSDAARDRMGKYAFMHRLSFEQSSSEESPAQSQPNEDGDSQEKPQEISTPVLDTKESLPKPS